MKRVKFLIIIVFMSTFVVNAQRQEHPNFDPKTRATRTIDELTKQITITQSIQDSLKVVFINFFEGMRKERESGNRPDMLKMESKRDLKVKSFLTNEQFKAYQKFMEDRKNRGNRPNRDGMHERLDGR
ncbi:MAG: hypothetical protein HXX16_17505 [Bacteroidales bacterium]|nr:hypothetical protein [Bacteroidales bacterium]